MKNRPHITKRVQQGSERGTTLPSDQLSSASVKLHIVTKLLLRQLLDVLQFVASRSASTSVKQVAHLKCLPSPIIAGAQGTGRGVSNLALGLRT